MHWKGEMWTKGQKCEPFLYYFVFSHMLEWRRTSGPVLGLPKVAQNAFPSHGSFSWAVSLNACFRLFLKTQAKPFMLIHLCSECSPKKMRISCANEIAPQIDLVGMSYHWLSIVSRPLSGWCDWHISWLILCFPDSIQKNDLHWPVVPWNALTGPETARVLWQGTGPGEFWSLIIILYTTRTGTMTDKLRSPVTSGKPSLPSCIQLPNIANVHAGI